MIHSGILAFFFVFVLVVLAIIGLMVVSMWKIYEKAGIPGWTVFIPFYNQVKVLQMTSKPLWWIILLFVPILNIVLLIIIARRLAAVFGKGVGFTWGLVLLPFIFYPILAFGNSTYVNSFPAPGPMSESVKWALGVAVLYMVIESTALPAFLNTFSQPKAAPLTVISSDLDYAADSNYVYYSDLPIRGADPNSFTVEGNYGMDDTAVYYQDQVLPGVNPTTFKVLDGGDYATSPTEVYYDGMVVLGADPATFFVTSDPTGKDSYDAKDKNGYYSAGEPYTLGSGNTGD